MNILAKETSGVGYCRALAVAALVLGSTMASAQNDVNLAQLLFTAPAKTTAERKAFREQFSRADILSWLSSIQAFAFDRNEIKAASRFKMAVALRLISDRAQEVPLAQRQLSHPNSSISLIEFYLSMLGKVAIDSAVFKQHIVFQLAKECLQAVNAQLKDEVQLCQDTVVASLAKLTRGAHGLALSAEQTALQILSLSFKITDFGRLPESPLTFKNPAEALAKLKERIETSLDFLRDYEETVDER